MCRIRKHLQPAIEKVPDQAADSVKQLCLPDKGVPLRVSYQRHAYEMGEHYNSVVPVSLPNGATLAPSSPRSDRSGSGGDSSRGLEESLI